MPEMTYAEAAILQAQNDRVRELERDNFRLAADQCHNGYGGEHGHHRCTYQDRIAELEAENWSLKKAIRKHKESFDSDSVTTEEDRQLWQSLHN